MPLISDHLRFIAGLILEIFSSWDIKKGQFQFLVTFLAVFSGLFFSCFFWFFLVHFTQNCILLYNLEAKNPYFVTKNCWKSSHICVFILSKKRRNWFHKTPHNSGTVGRRKLLDPSLNRLFNALSNGVQYMLSFQWTNFGLKFLMVRLWKYSSDLST